MPRRSSPPARRATLGGAPFLAPTPPNGPPQRKNAEAGLRPERVRHDEPRLYVADCPCGGFLSACRQAVPRKWKEKRAFPSHFSRLALFFASRLIGCGSEMEGKASFSFSFLSPCTIFRFAPDRLRLGNGRKSELFLLISLALHYLCTQYEILIRHTGLQPTG